MNYILHESGIGCDKDFEVKNSKKEKVRIVGFSKKLFEEKEKAASEKAQQTKNYSLAYHVIGTTFFKEAKEDDKDILKINQDIRARFLEDGPSWENDGLSVKPDYLTIPTGFDLSDMAGTIRNGTLWMKDA